MDLRRISTALTRQQKQSVVSIEEVKAQARVTDDSENDLISDYIAAAYDYLSGPSGWLNGYCLLEETYEFHVDSVLSDGVDLPLRPLRNITGAVSIQVRADDSTYSAVNTALYYTTSSDIDFPRLMRTPLQIWPGPSINPHPLTYRLTVVAGHEKGSDVPEPIRLSMKMLAAHWYANRETTGPAGRTAGAGIQFGLKNLCGRYRLAHDHS